MYILVYANEIIMDVMLMKKRLFAGLTASALSVTAALAAFPAGSLALPVRAADPITGETSDGFTYEITDASVSITGWTGDRETVTSLDIPDMVNGQNVNTIAGGAFKKMPALTSVTIPESVTSIGESAFENSVGLTEMVLPDSIESIGRYAFQGCTGLESVHLPESLTSIGWKAFYGTESLKEITIPKNITWSESPFEGSYIESAVIEDGTEKLSNSLFGGADHLTAVDIPDSVTSFGDHTFYYATSLTEFTIPKQITEGTRVFDRSGLETVHFEAGLTAIPDSIFENSTNLKTIDWTDDITKIGNRAFYSCTALETLDIPNTVKEIGNSAFASCDSLTTIHLPEDGCHIGSYLFEYDNAIREAYVPAGLYGEEGQDTYYMFHSCNGLETITFAEGITEIPQGTCFTCGSLTKINLPDGLETIGFGAFSDCASLTKVTFPDSLKRICNSAFHVDPVLAEAILPPNLEAIELHAFRNCPNLRNIGTIPKSLTEVGSDAFQNSGLTEVSFEDGTETIPKGIFASCYQLETVHIPASVKDLGADTFYNCINLKNLDMPFEPGDLQPWVNFHGGTFSGCYSLDDERVNVYDSKETFINRVETAQGENGLINYTAYYAINPLYAERFKDGSIEITTSKTNPIAGRSLPVGLRPEEENTTFIRYTFGTDEPQGVFRFSTEPQENADTEITVNMGVQYENSWYYSMWQRVRVNNDSSSLQKVSLFTPKNASVKDGTASFTVYGYAPIDKDVTIYVNGEEAVTATPNVYNGRYSANISCAGNIGDTLTVYAQSGEDKSNKQSISCRAKSIEVEKVILSHNNNHTGYTLDITDAFTSGLTPYIAYNPSKPLSFEVTLSDNDCYLVFVSSTVNGESSAIQLFFDEETGTWKGEGFFATRVPGTLNINAVPIETSYNLTKSSDGSFMIDGHKFLGELDENAIDIADDILADTDHVFAYDDTGVVAAYDFSEALGRPAAMANYIGRQKTLEIDGKTLTAEDVYTSPETYGFVESPMTYTDEDGDIHHYCVRIVEDTDEATAILDQIPAPEEETADPLAAPRYRSLFNNSVTQWIFNNMAEYSKEIETTNKFINGSLAVEWVENGVSHAVRGDKANDFVVNMSTTTEMQLLDMYAKDKGYNKASSRYGTATTYLEVFTQSCKMMHELRDIANSDDPRVQEHQTELAVVTTGTPYAPPYQQ